MYDRIIEAMHASLSESDELAARRGAEDQRLFISVVPVKDPEPHDYEVELHLVEPGSWRCIAVRRSWRHMAELVLGLSPGRMRKLRDRAASEPLEAARRAVACAASAVAASANLEPSSGRRAELVTAHAQLRDVADSLTALSRVAEVPSRAAETRSTWGLTPGGAPKLRGKCV